MQKNFFSVPEAAKLCGVSRITIGRWIKAGKLTAEKIGRNYAIPAAELSHCVKQEFDEDKAAQISAAVKKVVAEYGETLNLLAKE